MAKRDKHEKQLQRARSELGAALARNQAEDALDAWLALPVAERAEQREPLMRAVRAALVTLADRHDTQRALGWLKRLVRDPQLLADVAPEARVQWLLFAAALRNRQWALARSCWSSVAPAMAHGQLKAALETTLSSEGQQAAPEIAPLMAADAERLGRSPARPATSYSLPNTALEAETRCVCCFAREPFYRFAAEVKPWLERCTPGVAQTLRPLAAELTQRELLRRFDDVNGALEPARFCAHLVLAGPAAPVAGPLHAALSLALRVAARALEQARDTPLKHERQSAYVAVMRAACECPDLVGFVAPLLLAAPFDRADPRVLELAREALAATPSARLSLFAASLLHDRHADEDGCEHREAPAWLVSGVEQALQTPESFGAAFDAAGGGAAHALAHALLGCLPLELAVRVVDEAWPRASEDARQALADISQELVERMCAASGPRRAPALDEDLLLAMGASLGMPELTKAELRSILNSPDGARMTALLAGAMDADADLPVAMHPLWRKLEAHVVPYAVDHLETALSIADDPAAARALIEAFWSTRTTLVARVRAIADAGRRGLDLAEQALDARLFDQLVCRPADVLAAFEFAESAGAPSDLLRRLYGALLEALEREPAWREQPGIVALCRRCERRWGSEKKKKSKRRTAAAKRPQQGAAGVEPAATRKPRTRRQPAPVQAELPLPARASSAKGSA